MATNRYLPHVLVIPEDDANASIANGFAVTLPAETQRQFQIMPPAGGWLKLREAFAQDCLGSMRQFENAFCVLLADFDGKDVPARIATIWEAVPSDLEDRVFVLGSRNEPEDLKGDLGSLESIGKKLAEDCRQRTDLTWGHRLLAHNLPELERLSISVREILFVGS